MVTVTAIGAVVALSVAIVLILKKVPPAYGMLIGALVGGLIGGADLSQTVSLMIGGAQGITTAVMRILAAGVLAGVLIESGAASTIAETIVKKLGETRALLALVLSTMILTAVGVFVDVAVITVSPIALALAKRSDLSKPAILLAMIGGGKAGNIMSPNPNAIAASDAFHLPLTSVMAAGIIPAIFGIILTYFLAKRLINKGSKVADGEVSANSSQNLPAFLPAIAAPLCAIILLALRPIADIKVDPLIALPLGGLVGALAMGKLKQVNQFATSGLLKMSPVAVMLLGTGALAGIIANSGLKDVLIEALTASGLPSYLLAPISGALMSLATASTTAGTVVASNVFSATLIELGVSALASAAMIHSGATVLDHMPHGSFFHATGGSVNMDIKERLKLIPYETAVGLIMAIVSTLVFGVFKLF
ncbi:GntP family permease [Actinobacillus pleuropneumoniae]|uniref:GntP family permease n=1 Tax=Actinobacillus pleuropneumoniae TaxID=715 RepID=A0ABN5MGH9_ACTPL|nr:GntP family permease [Actinobacillus pleuropneumoniae]ASU16061.1 High-affinity gluconate transporter [Actinobacillus pleuropneumoniae]AWG94557.1 GntP family permease [Actinobacillus pleuropneumoniae serovar 1 str. 4074]AXA20630.1 GntP family permease [Actinobacillus pleuropneumoniae]MBL4536820.1 GntP family permease [Actinobacillus pleuropneumoniae]MCI1069877.1 GntP family permease [Actinobacillus pleuropneumoniae]